MLFSCRLGLRCEKKFDRKVTTVEVYHFAVGIPDTEVERRDCTPADGNEIEGVTVVFFEEHPAERRCYRYTADYRARALRSYRTHACEAIRMHIQTMSRSHVNMTAF